MRTAELLKALSQQSPGITIDSGSDFSTCRCDYRPNIAEFGDTVFEAAFKVAKRLFSHPDCPSSVKDALNVYDEHSQALRL